MANLDNGVVAVDLTALNSANRLLSRGYREVAFVLEGTSTQTVVCEVSMDGTTWYAAPIWDVDQYKTSGVTAAGIYRAVVTGSEYVRIRTSSYSSGTFTCRARLSEVSSLSQSAGGSGGGGSVTISGSLPAGTNNIGDVDVLTMPTATVRYSAPTLGSNIASTALNSLADGSTSAAIDYDNSSNRDEFADVELVLGSYTPGSSGTITLAVMTSADGTNYEDSAGGERYTLSVASGTGAKRLVFHRVRLYPFKCRLYFVNNSGGTLASSGNTAKIAPYNYVG